jgi:hypothetical protein
MKIRKVSDVFNPNNLMWGNWHYNQRNNAIELFDKKDEYCCVVHLDNLKDASDVFGMILYMKPRVENNKDFKDMISALEEFKGICGSFVC